MARLLLLKINQKYLKLLNEKVPENEIWDEWLQIDCLNVIDCLFSAFVHEDFEKTVKLHSNQSVLEDLRVVFAVTELDKYEGTLRLIGITDLEWENIQNQKYQAYNNILPKALEIIESFMIPDEILNSVLAKPDPYSEIIWAAKKLSPINQPEFSERIKKLIRPKL